MFNRTIEMTAKIVYYGPGLCGKTTNLMVISDKLDPQSRGELISLATTPDRTLFLPVSLGKVASFHLDIHLYTVPGRAVQDETRKVVLEDADGIVFVCDSQAATLAATRESFASLLENLAGNRIDRNEIPIVIQFNKRDICDALPVNELRRLLGLESYPYAEAAAIRGDGVMETFRLIAKITAKRLFAQLKADGDRSGKEHHVARMPSRFEQTARNERVNDTNVEHVLIEEQNVPLTDSVDERGLQGVQPSEIDFDLQRKPGFVEAKPSASPAPAASGDTTPLSESGFSVKKPDLVRKPRFVEAKPPASPTPVPASSGDTTRLFLMNSLADDYVAHGEYEKAANILEKLIDYEPQNPQHRTRLQFVRTQMSGRDTTPLRRPPPDLEIDEPLPSFDLYPAESEELSFDMDSSDELSVASFESPASPPASYAPAAFSDPIEIAAPVHTGSSVDDLDFITEHLTEAEVFAKYGMPEQANEHLRAAIDRIPQYIQGGDPRQVQEVAGRCFELARQQGLEVAEQAGQDLAKTEAPGRENAGLETVDCSVFAPDETRPGDSVLVQTFAHRRQAAALVEKLARDFDEDARRRGTTLLHASIQRGELLTFHLTTTIGIVDPSLQSARWDGEVASLQFGLAIPSDALEGNCLGTLIVSRESVPIGHLKFVIKIRNRVDTAAAAPTTARLYRKAFVSYAASDRVEVLKRVQMLSQLRVAFFQDILNLKPGAKWRDELFHQIDESDLFLLFWSSAARESEWVMNEVRYAIQRQASSNGEPEIMPVIVEGPPPAAPPPELQHLHFDDYLTYFMTAR